VRHIDVVRGLYPVGHKSRSPHSGEIRAVRFVLQNIIQAVDFDDKEPQRSRKGVEEFAGGIVDLHFRGVPVVVILVDLRAPEEAAVGGGVEEFDHATRSIVRDALALHLTLRLDTALVSLQATRSALFGHFNLGFDLGILTLVDAFIEHHA